MAFEAFLTHDQKKPKKGRRITYAVSAAVHLVVLSAGVVSSFGSVDELSPKSTPITFITGALPAPPPPPPPRGGRRVVRKTTRSTDRVVQPPTAHVAPPKAQDTDDAKDDDKAGPEGPGVPDGFEGSDGTGPTVETKFVPPNIARGQLAIDPQAEQHRARLPPAVNRAGMRVWAMLKICVGRDGLVNEVKVLKGVDTTIDASIVSAVKTWRYQPYTVDGRPVPFCTNVRYEIQSN